MRFLSLDRQQHLLGIAVADQCLSSRLVEWGFVHRLSNGVELTLVGCSPSSSSPTMAPPSMERAERHAVGSEVRYCWCFLGGSLDGGFAFDRLVRFYGFSKINQAFEDSKDGTTVKPILRLE